MKRDAARKKGYGICMGIKAEINKSVTQTGSFFSGVDVVMESRHKEEKSGKKQVLFQWRFIVESGDGRRFNVSPPSSIFFSFPPGVSQP